jgi:4-hydroxybenzoate polyprenyltransferase
MRGPVLPYLRLMRLPNVFTAAADVGAAFVIGRLVFSGGAWWPLAPLACASAALYLSGFVFNDVADRKEDALTRPERPIPSGAVSVQAALVCGGLLAAAGLLAALAAGLPLFRAQGASFDWAPPAWAASLVLLILLYDFRVKRRALLGPLAMGLCRGVNFQLGLSATPFFLANLSDPGLWRTIYAPALALCLYVAGVTAFSAQEESGRRPRALALGWCGVASGLALGGLSAPQCWAWAAFAPLAAALAYCSVRLLRLGTPQAARQLVRSGVLGICILDAGLVLGHGGLAAWRYALALALAILPAILLARWLGQREA